MNNFVIKQGDQYFIPITIKDKYTKEPVDISELELVEIFFGQSRHTYPDGDIATSSDGAFLVPITQEETFALKATHEILIDIRVKYSSGDVVGLDKPVRASIADAVSKEVL